MSASDLLKETSPRWIVEAIARRTWSTSSSLGLACDLSDIRPVRTPKVAVAMEPVDSGAFKGFHDELARVSGDDYVEVRQRTKMCDAGVPGLHVAFDPDRRPMYAQWLIDSANDALHSHSHGAFPRLRPSDTLVEGAYTFVAFRKLGVMSEGMRQLLVKAAGEGAATRCFTYVTSTNVASLRGCANTGFDLDHVRVSDRRPGRRYTRCRAPDGADLSQWQAAIKPRPPVLPADQKTGVSR